MNMLIENTTALVSKTEPQDYLKYRKISIKTPADYISLLSLLYKAILVDVEISNKSVCDDEVRKALKFIEEKQISSVEIFKESGAITDAQLQRNEKFIRQTINETNSELEKCK